MVRGITDNVCPKSDVFLNSFGYILIDSTFFYAIRAYGVWTIILAHGTLDQFGVQDLCQVIRFE